MVTQVTLGNFFTLSNGKTILGGVGGSGLDTDSLLKSLTEARRAPITRNEDTISKNGEKSTKLSEYSSLLNSFKASLDALRNPPGVGNAADNVFKFRVGSVPPNAASYVGITTSAGADIQSYEIKNISSVASAARQGTGTFSIASADDDVVGIGGTSFAPGEFEFNGQAIVIEATDSLNAISAKFNAVASLTGVTSTVVNVGPNNFRLSFTATTTGTDGSFDLTTADDPNDVLAGIGLTAATAGTNAIFELNGIEIERQTNTVSDVISGVTFNIQQVTPDAVTPYVVSVKPDTTTVQNVINRFVQDYNALKEFEAKQTKLNTDGTYDKEALLASNQTFLAIANQINSQVNGKASGISGSNPSSLVDIGLSFISVPGTEDTPDINNALNVNDGQLTAALNSNFDGVAKLFGFFMTSNSPNLTVFARGNSVGVNSFSLNIDPTDPEDQVFEATYDLGAGNVTVNLTATPLSGGVDGYLLKGQAGTALEGLELIYASNSAATISVSLTQGIGDKLFNTVQTAIKQGTGSIAIEQTSIQDYTDQLNRDIDSINQQVEAFQEQLIARFTALEQAIARVNNLLQSIDANNVARNAANS